MSAPTGGGELQDTFHQTDQLTISEDTAIGGVAPSLHAPQWETEVKGPPQACLFVANLSEKVTEDDILNLFGTYGDVLKVTMLRDNRSHPYAFVQFKTVGAAGSALQKANMHFLRGRRIRVERARVNCTLFVARLGASIDQSRLREIGEAYGPLDNVVVVWDPETRRSRGWGFLQYTYREDAVAAYAGLKFTQKRWVVEWAKHNSVDLAKRDNAAMAAAAAFSEYAQPEPPFAATDRRPPPYHSATPPYAPPPAYAPPMGAFPPYGYPYGMPPSAQYAAVGDDVRGRGRAKPPKTKQRTRPPLPPAAAVGGGGVSRLDSFMPTGFSPLFSDYTYGPAMVDWRVPSPYGEANGHRPRGGEAVASTTVEGHRGNTVELLGDSQQLFAGEPAERARERPVDVDEDDQEAVSRALRPPTVVL